MVGYDTPQLGLARFGKITESALAELRKLISLLVMVVSKLIDLFISKWLSGFHELLIAIATFSNCQLRPSLTLYQRQQSISILENKIEVQDASVYPRRFGSTYYGCDEGVRRMYSTSRREINKPGL
ncbi:hypothetical protein An12g07610 [Aspergillus niger]|uniref:Uncharacterized protein n=2 Tax=Aspergillus niger TaxID=5061 RepID=A2R071_ASPNC|nr:hypothetical protein An12g07610 [Aspergillus niger]CAK48500.1 hypothetical protein An12g07610 [Aspergillus niger]